MPVSGGRTRLSPGETARSVWVCAQEMPHRGHKFCGWNWVRKEKRPGWPHHLEASGELRPGAGVGGRSHRPPGGLRPGVKSQAPAPSLWVSCSEHDGLRVTQWGNRVGSYSLTGLTNDQQLWVGYFCLPKSQIRTKRGKRRERERERWRIGLRNRSERAISNPGMSRLWNQGLEESS